MDRQLTTSLFARLLGARFDALAPRVRQLHGFEADVSWQGRGDIQRGNGVLARLCAAVTSLPPSMQEVPVRVRFLREGDRETWQRDFGGHPMHSALCARGDLLCERLGAMQFLFRLSVRECALHWQVVRARVFGLVPLPAAWFAGVRCREREHAGRYEFLVEAALPLVGPLIRYEGWLERER